MQPGAACQFRKGKAYVVAKHLQGIAQVGPARQQRAPATSDGQPYNEDQGVQREEISTEPMQAQSHGQHARTEAYVVVGPVRRTAVLVQPWYVRAHPNADVRKGIKASRLRIRFVPIDRRCPINRYATQD